MPIAIGTQLGSHEITALLGKGGMGEVYRARDLKLKREVAIKILPEEFSRDTDRVSRFQREAEVLASLNHPNIAAIYDLQEAGGSWYLVLELVEGETLADRIARGPIPFEEALTIGKSICEGLEAAHEKGIIHRDLKPANIKLTQDGAVKVLDFGLARMSETELAATNLSNSPTLISAASTPGMIMGTAAYMSPEQASGKVADRRSDIWSFGAVVYEMLSGKQAFAGESVSETLASVIKAEPDWSVLPRDALVSILKLVRRCLTKDRKQRLQAIGEARIVLENPQRDEPAAIPPVIARLMSRLGWVSAALLGIALTALAFIHYREQPAIEGTQRYAIVLPENSTVHSFAISPDGRYIALAATVNGKLQLWLRPLDVLQAQPMPTTEDATYPFWSPDSRYIGFFAQGRLKKIAAGGGPAQSICDATGARGGSWNRENVILFYRASNSGQGIQRVEATGGAAVDIFKRQGPFRYPVFLPDGSHFLYTDIRQSEAGIYVSSLDGVEKRRLLPDRSGAVFAPLSPRDHAGYLLFVRENNLMAQRFDSATMQTSGDVIPVAESVSISLANVGYAPVTVSENGVLLYWTGSAAGGTNQMLWYDRTGKVLGPEGAPNVIVDPAISPDERVVAFTANRGNSWDIWLRDLGRATDARLTLGGAVSIAASWSPKGDSVVFTSSGTGAFGALYRKATSGSSQAELLLPTTTYSDRSEQWSRDGRFVTYTRINPETNLDVWVLPLIEATSSDRKPLAFLQTKFNESQGQLSPDSHWMAYTSDESGQREVYVRPFPPGDGWWRISTAGGAQPRWRGDGKELFYAAANGKMTAVPVKALLGSKPSFEPGVPIPLFDSHMLSPGTTINDTFQYDVTADGKRFLVVTNGDGTASSPPLTMWVNWTAGLKR